MTQHSLGSLCWWYLGSHITLWRNKLQKWSKSFLNVPFSVFLSHQVTMSLPLLSSSKRAAPRSQAPMTFIQFDGSPGESHISAEGDGGTQDGRCPSELRCLGWNAMQSKEISCLWRGHTCTCVHVCVHVWAIYVCVCLCVYARMCVRAHVCIP